MSIFDELYPASFNGATFYVEGTQTLNGGRKTVKFEYPNSDKRAIEDMGQLPDTFELEGIVFGDNYLLDRDALRFALNIPGVGILIHPFYGVLSVVSTPYTISENLNDLGVAKFALKFEKAQSLVFPSIVGSTLSLIGQLGSLLTGSLTDDLSTLWNVLPASTQNFLSANLSVGDLGSSLSSALSFLSTTAPTALAVFGAAMTAFNSGVIASIFNPVSLATNLFNSISTLMNISSDPTQTFSACQSLFTYGDNFVIAPPTTTDRIQNLLNQETLIGVVQTAALSNAYVQAAQIPYQNTTQLNIYIATLETQYQKVYNAGKVSSNSLDALQNLRNSARQFFDNIQENILNITPVQTVELPIAIIGYQYYGDIDHTNDLIQINPGLNPSFVSGTVNILAPSS